MHISDLKGIFLRGQSIGKNFNLLEHPLGFKLGFVILSNFYYQKISILINIPLKDSQDTKMVYYESQVFQLYSILTLLWFIFYVWARRQDAITKIEVIDKYIDKTRMHTKQASIRIIKDIVFEGEKI